MNELSPMYPCPNCGEYITISQPQCTACGAELPEKRRAIINLTPHELDIHTENGVIHVEPSGQVARLEETREVLPDAVGIPVTRASFGTLEGLPDPAPDTIYIVSALALQQCAGRNDVYAPGPAVRDAEGKIIGCKGLSAPSDHALISPSGFVAKVSGRNLRVIDTRFVEDDGTARPCLIAVYGDDLDAPENTHVILWSESYLNEAVIEIRALEALIGWIESTIGELQYLPLQEPTQALADARWALKKARSHPHRATVR